ncbi:MAG: hypothetical protein WC501_05585 [Candidatus Micrarchaeia archaeon]
MIDGITKLYYGMNISNGREPIDQIDFLLLVKKLKLPVEIFIAGKYGVLNNGKKPVEFFLEKESIKRELYKRLMEIMKIDGKVIVTDELWSNPVYWKSILELKDLEGVIDQKNGTPFNYFDSEKLGIAKNAMDEFLEVQCKMGGIPANSLYTLFEVAEARTLQKTDDVDCKIGPESEERYDKFIEKFMSIMQLYQPLDIKSNEKEPRPVMPYMERLQESRIFFEDTKEEVLVKISKMAQRAEKTNPFWECAKMRVPNPFCRMVIYAFEAAENNQNLPILLRGKPVYSSMEAIEFIEKSGANGLINIASPIAEAIWNYIILPVGRWKP